MDSVLISRAKIKKDKQLRKGTKEYINKYKKNRKSSLKFKNIKLINYNTIEFVSNTYNTTVNSRLRSAKSLATKVKEAGLFGLSGSNSDVSKKLNAIINFEGEKTLICNAYECDPGLVTDYMIMKNRLGEVVEGLKFLDKLIEFSKIVIATRENISIEDEKIQVEILANRYPLGYEKYLIKDVLKLDYEGLPTDNGIIVLNVQTILRIFYLACNNDFNSRFVTIANVNDGTAIVLDTPLNEKVATIASKYIGSTKNIYVGTGAFSCHKLNLEEAVDCKTNFIATYEKQEYKIEDCKGCGKCSKNCPQKVDCRKAMKAIKLGTSIDKEKLRINQCIGCGLCSFVCPQGKDVREVIHDLKVGK